MPYSHIPGVATPLAVLKDAAQVKEDDGFSFASWVEAARKAAAVASDCDAQGDAELAYVNYMKLAGILGVLLKHREYKQVRQAKGPAYNNFQALQMEWQPTHSKIKRLEELLQNRNGADSPSSVYSFPSAPSSPLNSTCSEPTKRTSIAERIAALQNSSGATNAFVKHSSTLSQSRGPLPNLPEDVKDSEITVDANIGLGLNSLRGVRRPLPSAPPAKPPKPASFAAASVSSSMNSQKILENASISQQTANDEEPPNILDQDIARPGSAPIKMVDLGPNSMADDVGSDVRPFDQSAEAPTILQTSNIHTSDADASANHLRPALDHSLSDFQSSFPSVQDIDEQYAFPEVPKGRIGSLPDVPSYQPSTNTLGRPPDLFPMERPTTTPLVSPAHSGSRSNQPSEDKPQPSLKRSSAMKAGLSGKIATPPHSPITLPFASTILPATLWAYVTAALPPLILLIDVRPRPAYEKVRIHSDNIDSICLEPIVLRKDLTSTQLEASMFDSTKEERELFARRSEYDLVVMADFQTTGLAANGAPANDDEGRCLWILNQAIYMREFGRSLKRSPVLLVGGLKAWQREIGPAGLIGTHVQGQDSESLSQTRAKLEGAQNHRQSLIDRGFNPPPLTNESKRPTSVSSLEEKKQNRRAVFYDDAHSPINRSVVDVIANPTKPLAYNPSNTRANAPYDPAYFSSRKPSLPFQSPSLAFPRPAARSNSGSQDQYKLSQTEYTSQPYTGYSPHVQQNHRPIDYPQIGPPAVNALQRPPLAAQPNGSPSRLGPPTLATQNRRISSQLTHTLSSSPTALSLKGKGDILVPLDWYDGTVGVTGLKNLGNTCYMNSTIQCLSATIPFSKFFTEGSFRKQINTTNPLGTRGALADTVAQLFRVLWEEQYSFVSPISFRDAICRFAPQFGGSDQHDSQEFLAFLLDGLHEDLNLVQKKPAPITLTPEREAELEALPTAIASHQQWEMYLRRDNSLIVHWFQGQYQSRLQCQTCSTTSTTFNTFMYLSLPIPRLRNKSVSLEDCVAAFCKEEIMEKEDAWNCPRCKVPRKATKRLTIARLPPILIIHFKRFSFHGPFSDKIDTPVDFPVYGLNLSSFLPPQTANMSRLYAEMDAEAAKQSTGSATYDLYGISQHFGTLSSGHYTAMIRSRHHWRHIGDTRMSDCDEGDVKRAGRSAYCLFYRQRQTVATTEVAGH